MAKTEVAPYDHDAELTLVRVLLHGWKRERDEILDQLGPADFHLVAHQRLVAACATQSGDLISPIVVADLVKDDEKARTIALSDDRYVDPHPANAVAIVARHAERRRLQAALGEVAEDLAADREPRLEALAQASHPAVASQRKRALDAHEFLVERNIDSPTVWGEGEEVLWAVGQSLMVVGPPGVGKTTVLAQLVAGRLGLQDEVLGYEMAMGETVLYLAMDRPNQIKGIFNRLLTKRQVEDVRGSLHFWEGPLEKDLTSSPNHLLELCERHDADTLVVDSAKDLTAGDISSDAVGGPLNRAFQTVMAAGVELLIAHHQRKGQAGGPKPKTLEDVHGNSAFRNGTGSVVLLWGEAGDPIVELTHLKQPVAPVGPLEIHHDHTTGLSTVELKPPDPWTVLKRTPGGVTAQHLAQSRKGGLEPNKNDVKKAERTLKQMVQRGQAVELPGEGQTRYGLAASNRDGSGESD